MGGPSNDVDSLIRRGTKTRAGHFPPANRRKGTGGQSDEHVHSSEHDYGELLAAYYRKLILQRRTPEHAKIAESMLLWRPSPLHNDPLGSNSACVVSRVIGDVDQHFTCPSRTLIRRWQNPDANRLPEGISMD
jgi:hypothetical protein